MKDTEIKSIIRPLVVQYTQLKPDTWAQWQTADIQTANGILADFWNTMVYGKGVQIDGEKRDIADAFASVLKETVNPLPFDEVIE